jgi:hypothetical protein
MAISELRNDQAERLHGYGQEKYFGVSYWPRKGMRPAAIAQQGPGSSFNPYIRAYLPIIGLRDSQRVGKANQSFFLVTESLTSKVVAAGVALAAAGGGTFLAVTGEGVVAVLAD